MVGVLRGLGMVVFRLRWLRGWGLRGVWGGDGNFHVSMRCRHTRGRCDTLLDWR